MGAEKRLQRLMDRVARKGGNTITIDGTDRGELQSKLIDNKASSSQWKRAKKLADKVMPSFQGVRPVENMSDEEAETIHDTGSVSRKSALNMLGVSNPLNIDTNSTTVDPKTEKPKRTPPSKDPDELSFYS
tara:strand:- start:57 stop:449 length:393 start_codon:yes stop_codon:yes gene_type:complete